jgi:hypothetical protein
MGPDNKMVFVKEAEGALVPVLLEKYGPEFGAQAAASAGKTSRTTTNRRDFGPAPLLDNK